MVPVTSTVTDVGQIVTKPFWTERIVRPAFVWKRNVRMRPCHGNMFPLHEHMNVLISVIYHAKTEPVHWTAVNAVSDAEMNLRAPYATDPIAHKAMKLFARWVSVMPNNAVLYP